MQNRTQPRHLLIQKQIDVCQYIDVVKLEEHNQRSGNAIKALAQALCIDASEAISMMVAGYKLRAGDFTYSITPFVSRRLVRS